MKTKAAQPRSMRIRLSTRTYNDLEKFLREQEEGGTSKKHRYQATLLRRRLERAPRLNLK